MVAILKCLLVGQTLIPFVNCLVAKMSKAFKVVCTYSVSTNASNSETILEAFLMGVRNEKNILRLQDS
jgi:hypothetical protein